MKQVRVIKWLISLQDATRLMKKLNSKAHRGVGYYFEYEDVGEIVKYVYGPRTYARQVHASQTRQPGVHRIFGSYAEGTKGGLLTVYRDVEDKVLSSSVG